jgi:hypothetical protein
VPQYQTASSSNTKIDKMTKLELLKLIEARAKEYSAEARSSLVRNNHMNEIKKDEEIDQRVIDAVLVDFINYIGVTQGVDYGLYTSDLRKSVISDLDTF